MSADQIITSLLGTFRRSFDFSGRSERGEFTVFALFAAAAMFALAILDHVLLGPSIYNFSLFFVILVFVPSLSLLLRRFRDAGLSPFLLFLLVVGLPGLLLLAVLGAVKPGGAPALPPVPGSAGAGDHLQTLLALGCYGVTFYGLFQVGRDAEASKADSPWLSLALFSLPLVLLGVRHLLTWKKPWPRGTGTLLSLYLIAIFMITVSSGIFSGLMVKSAAGNTQTRLEEMRAALSRAAAQNPGAAADMAAVLPGPELLKLPVTPHAPTKEIRVSTFTDIRDGGTWLYDGSSLLIDCTHQDPRGRAWSSL